MYAQYECHFLVGIGTEAELLVKLLTSWAVLLQSSTASFDSVRELGRRIKVLLEKAALYSLLQRQRCAPQCGGSIPCLH